jgi:hypothetical protein
MPCEKGLNKLIPAIYKRSYEDIAMFFFVKGQMQLFPTLKLEQGIENFFRHTGISVEEWDILSARQTYTRMQHDFFDNCKHEATPPDK